MMKIKGKAVKPVPPSMSFNIRDAMNKNRMIIYVNGVEIFGFKFGGGECHVSVDMAITEVTKITAYLRNSDDIMLLLLTVDAVKRINHKTKIDLFIPYFPYARQDRVCLPGEPLSVSVMAGIINSLNCNEVVIADPHSDVTPALINNCKIVTQSETLENSKVMNKLIVGEGLTLVSPDAGAEKKIVDIANRFDLFAIFCTKNRNLETGEIVGVTVPELNGAKDFIIIDDICDGGRTFIALAEALKEKGAGDLYLYVTHGIFSYGLDVLRSHYKNIYCYHTFLCDYDKDYLITFKEGA